MPGENLWSSADPASHRAHFYQAADFRVLGEAESVIDKFVEAWEAGTREGLFEAEKFKTDVTKTPIPRFDLLKFDDYLHIGVQFSRGCPFTCEFCDIIELYGRVPRAKTSAQMLAELDELYPSWLSRSRRLRGRQSHRQQKGREGLPSRAHKVARSTRLSLRVHNAAVRIGEVAFAPWIRFVR